MFNKTRYTITTRWNGNEKVRKFTFEKSLESEIKRWWGDIFETEITTTYGGNISLLVLNDDGTDSGKCIRVKDMDEHYETWWECDKVMKKAGIPKSFTAIIAPSPYIPKDYTHIPYITYSAARLHMIEEEDIRPGIAMCDRNTTILGIDGERKYKYKPTIYMIDYLFR